MIYAPTIPTPAPAPAPAEAILAAMREKLCRASFTPTLDVAPTAYPRLALTQEQECIVFVHLRQLQAGGRAREAAEVRDLLVRNNLPLVAALVRRGQARHLDLHDAVSFGEEALLRAVDGFDPTRGYRFSTYACRAILTAGHRTAKQQSRRRQTFQNDTDLTRGEGRSAGTALFASPDWREQARLDTEAILEARRHLARLPRRERLVLTRRFGLDGRVPADLARIGRSIGMTKERVRQIQNAALASLRLVMESSELQEARS